jgi:hypothetical protein
MAVRAIASEAKRRIGWRVRLRLEAKVQQMESRAAAETALSREGGAAKERRVTTVTSAAAMERRGRVEILWTRGRRGRRGRVRRARRGR